MKHFLILASALLLGACEIPEGISNADLNSWCGDMPCGWDVEGDVRRVSTWHSNDYAAELGEDARLSQLNEDFSSSCISFSMLAKVSKGARAFVELDFLDDGIIDSDEQIPETNFQPLEFRVAAPAWYSSVRFIVRREGSQGEVVLARLQALGSEYCPDADRITLDNLPGGGPCQDDDECATKACRAGYCVGCETDDECEDGQTCGYAEVGTFFDDAYNVVPMCTEPNQRQVGALCLGDAECAIGMCCEGVCSPCCGAVGCDDDESCRRSAGDGEDSAILEPHLCSPGLNKGAYGDYCTANEDCEGTCEEYVCTGLCSSRGSISESCAMLACDEAQCSTAECGVETLAVGRCR